MNRSKCLGIALLTLLTIACFGCVDHQDDFVSKYCPGSCTVIKGRLTTANGTAPLGGVTLVASWHNLQHTLGGGTIRKKAVARTDADGNYELRFLIRDNELEKGYFNIEIALDPKQYLSCGKGTHAFSLHHLTRDTTLEVNYEAARKAFIEVQLTNPEAVSDGNYFSTTFTSQLGLESCGNVINWHNGSLPTSVITVAADQAIQVQLVKNKKGEITVEYDTLSLSTGQKLIYKVEF